MDCSTYSRDREWFMRAELAHAVGWGKLAGNERNVREDKAG
jgi:hypothetical protein